MLRGLAAGTRRRRCPRRVGLRAASGLYCRCEVRLCSRHEHVLHQGDVNTFPSRTPTLGLPLQGQPLDVVASQGNHATPGVRGSQRLVDDYHASAVTAATCAATAAHIQPRPRRTLRARRHGPGTDPARPRHGGGFIGYLLAFSNTARGGCGTNPGRRGPPARARRRLKPRAVATMDEQSISSNRPHRPPSRPRNFGTATRCVPCRPC